jgi:uncharacterized damage-inducible protein DinB
MNDFFNHLFDYNHDANQRLWHALYTNKGAISEKSLTLFGHILNAHQIWNNRIEHRHAAFEVWQRHDLDSCQPINNENYAHTSDILRTLDLNAAIEYTRQGKKYHKTVSEILFHMINHSTYHRAQIATEFRQSGLTPLSSDFILFEKKPL